MTEDVSLAAGPLFEGFRLPFDELPPDKFEAFVFACLLCVQDLQGLRITGNPSGTGDGGFDVEGEVVASKRGLCVQCKRQQDSLSFALVAHELAKVAAQSKLHSFDVGEHRFLCSGGVAQKLRTELRKRPWTDLAAKAAKLLTNAAEGELATLKTQLVQAGEDPALVAKAYVEGLDSLIAWDLQELDAALSSRWDDAVKVIKRYFRIATVVREHPRAQFDRRCYRERHVDFRVVLRPRFADTKLPAEFATTSAANPLPKQDPELRSIRSVEDLAQLAPGELALLIADGGVGKSTVLDLVRAEILSSAPESSLPVVISVADYVPGNLDASIHAELGVKQGTWRSLPDRIVLLCDGVNEASNSRVQALFKELHLLLVRDEISCVLTTRSVGRATPLVLPKAPTACTRLQSLTPIGVRRLAATELSGESQNEFVAAHARLTEGAGSEALWTPFAVLTALAVWLDHGNLPEFLGEMMEKVLDARVRRDVEIQDVVPEAVRRLPPESIRELASAIAFQLVVIEQRLSCPNNQARTTIRNAIGRCSGALGLADLSDLDLVGLLDRHELVRVADGQLRFAHQLVAGALAAPMLAKHWREHTDCLGQAVVDDAWVFAVRFVPEGDRDEYLRTVLDASLHLGARTARELPEVYRETVASQLADAASPGLAEPVRLAAFFSLSRLGGLSAIEVLKRYATDKTDPMQHVAARATAASGDLSYLRELLPEIDERRAGGFGMSGGEIDVWQAAPLPARLRVARERVETCKPGAPVNESLHHIAIEEDPDDTALVERHLAAADELTNWTIRLRALRDINPDRAAEIARAMVNTCTDSLDRVSVLDAIVATGIHIPQEEALEYIVALGVEHADGRGSHNAGTVIKTATADQPLPPNSIERVEQLLPTSEAALRSYLWQISCAAPSSALTEYAISTVDGWSEDVGYACNYLLAQEAYAQANQQRVLDACESGLEREDTWYTWDTWRALELVGKLGFTERSARALSSMIQRLVRVLQAAEDNKLEELAAEDAKLIQGVEPKHVRNRMGHHASQLVPAIRKARSLLGSADVLSMLRFDLSHYSCLPDIVGALEDISDLAIDATLARLRDPWVIKSSLLVTAHRGATTLRVQMLKEQLLVDYNHLAALHIIGQALQACWCTEVCDMVVAVIAGIPEWSEYDSQFFWEIIRVVAGKIGPEDKPILERALQLAKTDFARRVLTLWIHDAAPHRIGMRGLVGTDPQDSASSSAPGSGGEHS